MAKLGVDVSELEDLADDLARGGQRVGAQGAAALRKTAYDIESDSKQFVRVDTGFLKGSISTDLEGDGRYGQMAAEIGPTAEYGIFQELGTSVMAGQPYMGPAFERRVPPFEQAIAQIGGDLL